MWAFLAVLGAWIYARYTGEYREVSVAIDDVADLVWEQVSLSSLVHALRMAPLVFLYPSPMTFV